MSKWKLLFLIVPFIVPLKTIADIQISNLQDLAFGNLSIQSVDDESNDDICVYNSDSNNYRITATGSGNAGAFVLSNGFSTISYMARWNNQSGTQGNLLLEPGIALSTTNASQIPNCNGSTNANIQIIIPASARQAARAGSYGGTLSFLIEPN